MFFDDFLLTHDCRWSDSNWEGFWFRIGGDLISSNVRRYMISSEQEMLQLTLPGYACLVLHLIQVHQRPDRPYIPAFTADCRRAESPYMIGCILRQSLLTVEWLRVRINSFQFFLTDYTYCWYLKIGIKVCISLIICTVNIFQWAYR